MNTKVKASDFRMLRAALADFPGDISADAVGSNKPKSDEMFAPSAHAAALNPASPVVVGSRGAGKSFWSGVLGDEDLRNDAARAYPKLGLDRVDVGFGFTGYLGGPGAVSVDALKHFVPESASHHDATSFWWATVLHAGGHARGDIASLKDAVSIAKDWEARERVLADLDASLAQRRRTLLVVYDALDTIALTWPRRRLLTQALFEVVWSMRAYQRLRVKLFLRPDQLNDDALVFVELPKLRTGAVRLTWTSTDLYGLLFTRLLLHPDEEVRDAFLHLLRAHDLPSGERPDVLARRWSVAVDETQQRRLMASFAGAHMASGAHGYKKGNTYDWAYRHLGDASGEVTPRSFLGLMIAASAHGVESSTSVMTPEGIRHGLRAASKTRVDQLHQEFPWIKAALAPLAGVLLPVDEKSVFSAWRKAKTVSVIVEHAQLQGYLAPFPDGTPSKDAESALFGALAGIGVMFRRPADGRLDMPDLYRVASKLLKKGATTPQA